MVDRLLERIPFSKVTISEGVPVPIQLVGNLTTIKFYYCYLGILLIEHLLCARYYAEYSGF